MRKVRRIRQAQQEAKGTEGTKGTKASLDARPVDAATIDTKVALIQALIPLGLMHVAASLQQEVEELTGPRYSRQQGRPGLVRHGSQRGSVYLGDQKLPIRVPRVRDQEQKKEVPLATYRGLQVPRDADEGIVRRLLAGLICRQYEKCAEAAPTAFGLSASTISRRYIRASARKLQALSERRLEGYDLVALFLDGKTFATDSMVIAVGVTMSGEKVILGFVQTGTENASVCATFLRGLVERGLNYADGLLVVLDGAKGLRRGVKEVFGAAAVIQRCQWHKRENVLAYLPRRQQDPWRMKLNAAHGQRTYTDALAAIRRVRQELARVNKSAVASLDEGLEETLTLQRLGLFKELGTSFKTTNCLETINAQVARRTVKITYWKNSDQKQRWLATALVDLEPRLRIVKGHRHLPRLRRALQAHMERTEGKAA
jgi:transposase-like protein